MLRTSLSNHKIVQCSGIKQETYYPFSKLLVSEDADSIHRTPQNWPAQFYIAVFLERFSFPKISIILSSSEIVTVKTEFHFSIIRRLHERVNECQAFVL